MVPQRKWRAQTQACIGHLRSSLNQTLPDGVPYQAGGLMSVKFLHDSGPMRGYGLEAYSESFRNLLGTLAVCDQIQDLLFTAGQESPPLPASARRCRINCALFSLDCRAFLSPVRAG
jgi:hypothetical protein